MSAMKRAAHKDGDHDAGDGPKVERFSSCQLLASEDEVSMRCNGPDVVTLSMFLRNGAEIVLSGDALRATKLPHPTTKTCPRDPGDRHGRALVLCHADGLGAAGGSELVEGAANSVS